MRLLSYVRPYWLQLATSTLLMAATGVLDGFRLLLIGPVFDRVLNPAARSQLIVLFRIPGTEQLVFLQQFVPQHFKNAWTVVAFALLMATLLKAICEYGGTYLVNYAGLGMITDLRNRIYEAILRRSDNFFSRSSTGALLSNIINDVGWIQYAMSSVLAELLQQLFALLFTACVVVLLGGRLAWVLLLFVPFIVLSAQRIGKRVRHRTRHGLDRLADVQQILHESVTGNLIVKAFGMESWESLRFHSASRRLFRANMRSVRTIALSSPLMDLLGAVAVSLLLLLGRDRINHQVFTTGTFLAFIVAVFKLYDPVRKLALYNNNFQQALGASATLFSFMDQKDDVHEKPHAATLPRFRQSIRFERVNFSYGGNGEGDRQVLRDIDLEVNKGERLAIVGSSGAGKSTLVHLIPRFFDVSSGRVLIDGHDVRDLTLASLRRQIGIVTQETILFNDSVRNNIAYGQPHASDGAVIAAAKAALAHDFIQKMPAGYETVIGERGLLLSGGERQRIAIARVLLKNAPILILDEATSALDSEAEALVQAALQNLVVGRTAFLIAHRLSTVRRADRIVVLENGNITETGTHEDLLSRLGTYRRLYDLQFLDAEPQKISASSAES
jgi:ATP-binding cassette, subfamily B, bacterial MsbA